MLKIFHWLNKNLLWLILLLAFLVRFYGLCEHLNWSVDQSLAVWPIIKLFEEKKLTLIGVYFMNPKSAIFRPPFFTYLFVLPWWLFNFHPLALEGIFALIGVAGIYFLYRLALSFFGKNAALIASFFYAINPAIINIDKTIHTITPVIITSTLSFLGLALFYRRKKNYFLLLTGLLIGLGMSFHFQIIITLVAVLFLIFIDKEGAKKKVSSAILLISGFLIFISPLIIFNLRHNFIMLQGFKRTFFSNEVVVSQSKGLSTRAHNALLAFGDLVLEILPKSRLIRPVRSFPLILFIVGIVLPAVVVQFRKPTIFQKIFMKFYWLVILVSLTGLAFVNQGFYGDASFYLWFFIPLLLIVWARLFELLTTTRKIRFLMIILLTLYAVSNLNTIVYSRKGHGSYMQKMEIINYIFDHKKNNEFTIKFIGVDVLAYDYLFYYAGRSRGVKYENFHLLEEWNRGGADFFLLESNYDFARDIHRIKPFSSIMEFGEAKLVIKN